MVPGDPAGTVATVADPTPASTAAIRLPLPATHLATALVLRAVQRDEDPDSTVSREAGALAPGAHEPLARHIGDLRTIDLPDLTVAPMPPVELLAVFGADEATCRAVLSAGSGVAVALVRPRDEALSAERAVRAAAAVLSGPGDVTIDTAVPRVWPVRDRSTDVPRSADWFVLDRITTGERSGTRTHGLARFGLPELLVEDVAEDDLPAWDAAFVGVAHVLLARLEVVAADELLLDASLRLTVADVAAGYSEPYDESDPTVRRGTALRLELLAGVDDPGVLRLSGTPVQDLFG